MRAPLIQVRNVRKSFNNFVAVEDLNFSVAEGEIVALLGRTGAGKSTVLNLVMGTIKADSGEITVAGHDPHSAFGALRGRIAVSFQTDRLLPWRTAIENAELGLLILGLNRAEARSRAQQWLDRVKLTGAEDKYVHELSGGMRQRVSLARALAVDPAIIFLDESFSQLDHVTSHALRGDFRRIAREFGKTCLLVTHRIDDALELADRALILAPGAHIVQSEDITEAARSDPSILKAIYDRIAAAMGDTENVEQDATYEVS
ncbi:MAG: ABC transporter ATP-binding protein [Methylobacteriaceae bacterium]|nr:ABC transporter ATP-binding protein [Methylobacteriaceae bacterium]